MNIINTLIPIFLIVLMGAILRSRKLLSENFFKQSNWLIYWIGLPCLLFIKTAQVTVKGNVATRISSGIIIGMLVCMLVAYIIGWVFKIPATSLGAFVQGSFRSNLFYVGLPVVLFALSDKLTPDLEALAVLVIAPMTVLYNIFSVLALLIGNPNTHKKKQNRMRTLFINIITNPLLLAVALGITYSFTQLKVPVFIERAFSTIGQMSLPLALLGIGATLKLAELKNRLFHATMASIIKVLIAPIAGLLFAKYWGLTVMELQIALIYLACPTAVASYVMAEQLKGDHQLAGNIVIISTILSFPALALVLTVT